ncbi:hypothetical protein QSH18_07480 [Xanthomonas sp. NCPPB 2654]|uniref:hypothetical protein n=1 Tax=unclassified Xanthomonas TaxID=2643310 RepID=UPI0021DFFCF8|nr:MULTISPECIES: hypothetical protein [unclassified Xanthomonas]MDL5365443.1 hypothetical protein [Xanthomonas sp. NCPPB 2654]UYC20110.1 hypothetical protein NUG20_18405 [Xanthomonas sp. CFBP 8443]
MAKGHGGLLQQECDCTSTLRARRVQQVMGTDGRRRSVVMAKGTKRGDAAKAALPRLLIS